MKKISILIIFLCLLSVININAFALEADDTTHILKHDYFPQYVTTPNKSENNQNNKDTSNVEDNKKAENNNKKQNRKNIGSITSYSDNNDYVIKADYFPQYADSTADPLQDFVPPSTDFLDDSMVTRSITKKINVSEPCDQTWRNKHQNSWMWEAHQVVIESDHILEASIGVQFYSVSQKYWNRSTTNYSDQIDEVTKEWGLSGADMMIAFSGQTNNGGAMGVAYFNAPYALIFDYGQNANRGVGQHETGHTYGLDDYCKGRENSCCGDGVCIMNGGYQDKICSYCDGILKKNANKY